MTVTGPTGVLQLRTVGWGRSALLPVDSIGLRNHIQGWDKTGEWWYPLASGVGQSWTFSERPEGMEPLTIAMEASGAEVSEEGEGLCIRSVDGSRWRYEGVEAEDANGQLLSAWLEATTTGWNVRVDDRSATWPIRVDPILTNANGTITGSASSYMGQAVAGGDVDGDGYSDLLVGAYRLSTRGVVYVYAGNNKGFSSSPVATLYPATSGYDGFFGWEIEMGDFNGDGYSDAAVSEPEYSNGTVYVFMGSSAGLSTTASMVVSGSTTGERNGYSLAAGDWNHDGYMDLVAGNLYRNTYGAADIYYGSASGLSSANKSSIDLISSFQKFANSAASAGDVNNDGYEDLILGHYEAGSYYGRAWIYNGSASGLASTPSTTLSGPVYDTYFGKKSRDLGM